MPMTKFELAILSCAALGANYAYAATAMIYVSEDTHYKTSTAQASSLPASSKCLFTKGQALQISSVSDGGASHFKVNLPRAYTGCALKTGYFYAPHVSTNATAITANADTVFKKTTDNSSALPASSKCSMPAGVYPLSGAATVDGSHFKVNLKSFLPNCTFSQGFIFDGHANNSIQQLSLADSVYLKKTTADSSTLPATSKCLIAKGNYVLTAAPGANGEHYSVSMVNNPAGCAFKSGFVYFSLTYLAAPSGGTGPAPSTGYTRPLENGIAGGGGQAWCVCRNIGTSPHIGQDWNASGAERSLAISNGTIVDKGFSSVCGHTLTLRDSGGADWIYRHLNSNSIQEGQNVSKGQFLGNHSSYPLSGCGSGAHLHIERRSAGAFGDREAFKSCEAGPEACNFNPNSPFLAKSTLASNDKIELAAVDSTVAAPRYCRSNPSDYPSVELSEIADYQASKQLSAQTQREWIGEQARLTAALALPGNAENSCAEGKNCLLSWSAVAVNSDGSMQRLFHDGAVRNRAAAVIAEEEYCLSDKVDHIVFLARDRHGARYQVQSALKD